MIGLFETGYVREAGFFRTDTRERWLQSPGMSERLADAVRRGKAAAEGYGVDLFRVDVHAVAARDLGEVRDAICLSPKSADAIAVGSVGVFDPEGMSDEQRAAASARPSRE